MAGELYKPGTNTLIIEHPNNSIVDVKGRDNTDITYNIQGDGYIQGSLSFNSIIDANKIDFVSLPANSGNFTLKVAPVDYAEIDNLADGYDQDSVISLSNNGFYEFTVKVLCKDGSGNYYKAGQVICGSRDSGTLTIQGSATNLPSVGAGLTITVTASTGNVNVNIQNDTGETLDGRMHIGWEVQDLITFA